MSAINDKKINTAQSLQKLIDNMGLFIYDDIKKGIDYDENIKKKHFVHLQQVVKNNTTMRGVFASKDIPKGSFWLEREAYSVIDHLLSGFTTEPDALVKEMMRPYQNKQFSNFLVVFGYKDITMSLNVIVTKTISEGAPGLSMLNHCINGNVDYYWYEHDYKDAGPPELLRLCCTNRLIQEGEELTTSYFSLADTAATVSNRYYKDRKFEMEKTAEPLLNIWDEVRDKTNTYMGNNPIFLQIQQDLINSIDGKPCMLSEKDIKKEEELILDSIASDFVGTYVINTMCKGHYTLKKIEHLLQIRFWRLFPCESFIKDRLNYMRCILSFIKNPTIEIE